MNKRAAALVAAFAIGLGGCSEQRDSFVQAPELVTTDNLAGASVQISKNRPLVIPVDDDHPERWTEGGVDDESVAAFVPGKDDGKTNSNPGFEAVSKGTTGASLTDPNTGESIEFTITVK